MPRIKCRSYLRDEPSKKKRVVIAEDDTMASLVKDLSERFSVDVAELQDPAGCTIERIEDIFEDDTLVVVPVERTPISGPDSGPLLARVPSGGGPSSMGGGSGGAGGDAASTAHLSAVTDPSAVLELQMLSCASVSDFVVDVVVASGQNGIVFAAKCTLPGLPRPNKTYALKLVFNFGVTTRTGANEFENEYKVLSQIHPHVNLSRFWGTIWDKIPDDVVPHLPEFAREQANYVDHAGVEQRRKALFIIFDFHPQSLEQHLTDLPAPLPFSLCVQYVLDLLQAVAHLDKHRVAHLDLKLDNVLVAIDDRLVVCDFGSAVLFKDNAMALQYHTGFSPGGNLRHLAPEVLSAYNRARGTDALLTIPYDRQEVWAIGVICYELALRCPPWPDYPTECQEESGRIVYDVAELPALPADYPAEFTRLVHSMLALDPSERMTAAVALDELRRLVSRDGVLPEGVVLRAGGGGSDSEGKGSEGSARRSAAPADWAAADAGSSKDDEVSDAAAALPVTVKSVTGAVTVVRVLPTDPVRVLRERATKALLPDGDIGASLLLYAGSRLDDDWLVGDFGLEAESCLHLVRPPPARTPAAAPSLSDSKLADDGEAPEAVATDARGVDRGGAGGMPVGDASAAVVTVPADAPSGRAVAFSTEQKHAVIELGDHDTSATGNKKTWGTVLVAQEAVSSGRHVWKFHIDCLDPRNKGGMAIGVVSTEFDWRSGILGAHRQSWGYSGRTGDKGDGSGFVSYGERYGTLDTVGIDLDIDSGVLRFSKNGKDQGIAFRDVFRGMRLAAAVCIGGVQRGGGYHRATVTKYIDLSMAAPGATAHGLTTVLSFDPLAKHEVIQLSNGNITATGNKKTWGTVLVSQEPLVTGRYKWKFVIDHLVPSNKGGMAIGVVSTSFNWREGILGAHADSWGYSGRTGDKGDGTGFVAYGEPYATGDTVGVDLDVNAGTLRFFKNGVDQGVAFSWGLKGKPLLAAVCIGGVAQGFHQATVVSGVSVPTGSRKFSATRKHEAVRLSNSNRTATGSGRTWGTVLVDQPFVTSGVHTWEFMVDCLVPANKGGMAVGVVSDAFSVESGILGAHAHSWGYSGRTGDRGDGSGFVAYGERYATGDVVTVELNADAGTLEFRKNGVSQGMAFTGLAGLALAPALCVGGVERPGGYHEATVLP
mmetsp:Transcript_5106/g.18382  ORF Transcript_5106/g.18382 Transcript_5106/m.18382 type:complete len:1165 (-) Transcript_5106:23-3517(-)